MCGARWRCCGSTPAAQARGARAGGVGQSAHPSCPPLMRASLLARATAAGVRVRQPTRRQPTHRTMASAHAADTARPGVTAGGRREAYVTIAAPVTHTHEAKKSRFVTTAWPVSSPAQCDAAFAAARDPGASHNCWAYKCGPAARCSDDGEPGGTAGRPMLAAIEGEGLDGVAVLVVRYFGGTKLGAGGLTRAYGAAARDCLRAAGRVSVQPLVGITVDAAISDTGAVYAALDACSGVVREGETYADADEGGNGVRVRVAASAPRPAAQALADALARATAGRAVVRLDGD